MLGAMPLGVSSMQWDLRIAWNSKVSWAFSLFQPGGIVPYNLTGHTFAWVMKLNPADVSPLILLTTDGGLSSPIPANAGTLVEVTSTDLSSVILTLYPPATSALSLTNAGFGGFHALWMDYADAQQATNLFWGQFYVDPAIAV
jgi:hypothetical protein